MGRSHFSFDGERKVCKRKPAARHSRGGPRRYAPWASVCGALWAVLDLGSLRSPAGKKASTAHFDGGARNVARDLVGQITPTLVRAPVLTFFRRQNGRAFFPSLPNAALLPPQLALGILRKCRLGCFTAAWVGLQRKRTGKEMICRLSLVLLCSPFSAVKMGGPFSLRCLTPLCFPAVGDWYTQRDVGWRLCCSLDDRAAQRTRLGCFSQFV